MPSTKPRSEPPPAALTAVDRARELITEQKQLLQAHEAAVRHELETGERVPNLHLLQRALGLDRDGVAAERSRIEQVLAWQDKAATAADRAAAREKQRESQGSLDTERPELELKIQQAQARISELENAAQAANATVATQSHAVEFLRGLVPPWIRQAADDAVQAVLDSSENLELVQGKARIEAILSALAVAESKDADAILDHADSVHRSQPELSLIDRHETEPRSNDPHHPMHATVHVEFRLNQGAWSRYVSGLRQELPVLEARVAELESIIATRLQDAKRPLDFYAR